MRNGCTKRRAEPADCTRPTFGLQPPALGGEGLDRVDVALTASGLESFESEFARARDYDLDGVPVKVLPLERVIVSKRGDREGDR